MSDPHREHLYRRLAESGVPEGLREGLVEYIAARRPTGHFLEAVLSNDLAEACKRADEVNRHYLYEIFFFLWNYAPGTCFGSPTHVQLWLAEREPVPEVFE